ncbi:SMP-30/gluconolactonase/LRE family protein [Streptomyces sp. NPDC004065]|uniref:SMP-30/gluconolactonase/LRE family protein n=1 Tax=Streptomyces sp. NPDC004065 TaxID=3364689 RepID=UPI00384DE5E3
MTSKPILLASGFALAEGPVVHGSGALCVADALAGGVRVLHPGGGERQLLAGRKGVGGLVVHASGALLASGRTVVATDWDPSAGTEGCVEVLTDPRITGFNDLGVGPEGELLAGMLRYRPFRGEPAAPGGLRVVDVAGAVNDRPGEVIWPNGVAVAGEWLYLSDFATGTVLRARWSAGEGQELTPWWRSPSGQADGLAVDAEGAVMVALGSGGAVARVLPNGDTAELIPVPSTFVSSVCFRGAGLERLVVCTADNTDSPQLGGCVFELPAPVPGTAVPPAAIPLPNPT